MVLGVIGADVHAVGNQILNLRLYAGGLSRGQSGRDGVVAGGIQRGGDRVRGGARSSFRRSTDHGELDCRGLRERCDEAGLGGILLYVGGNIVVGKQPFEAVKKRFEPWALTGYSGRARRRR
jgi:methylaspartate mutase sigma subunit